MPAQDNTDKGLREELDNLFDNYYDGGVNIVIPADESPTDAIMQLIAHQVQAALQKRDEQHQEVYNWLLGTNGDFPESIPGTRYNWRKELRERIQELQAAAPTTAEGEYE